MYKITSIATGKIIIGCVPTEREATMVAIEETQRMLIRTAEGRRLIGWCKGRCTWDIAKQYVIVERMIGDWIFVKEAECVPEETTEDFDIVFILKRGLSRYLGMYDAEEGEFVDQGGENEHRFSPERVLAYMFLPYYEED